MSTSLPNRARYPFHYAESVVDSFIDSYARVINFVAKRLHIESLDLRMKLIAAFMYCQPRWVITRDVLKTIHHQNLYDELPAEHDLFTQYLTCVKYICEDNWLDRQESDEREKKYLSNS